jgi:hypothetical protein
VIALVTCRSSIPENPVEFTVRPENPTDVSVIEYRSSMRLIATIDAKLIERATQNVGCGVDQALPKQTAFNPPVSDEVRYVSGAFRQRSRHSIDPDIVRYYKKATPEMFCGISSSSLLLTTRAPFCSRCSCRILVWWTC